MFLISPLPDELQDEHALREFAAARALAEEGHAGALRVWEEDYQALFTSQPPMHRHHKGQPLTGIGALSIYLGDRDRAVRSMVAAFVEDALSRAEESPGRYDELLRTAAYNLVYPFGVPGRRLIAICGWARTELAAGRYHPDPFAVLDDPVVAAAIELVELATDRRVPGQFGSHPTRRVFVGAAYKDERLNSVVRPLRDMVIERAYDPIVPADFVEIAGSRTDEHALLLLASSHYAVFEASVAGGYEAELRALPDSMRERTLVVFDKTVTSGPAMSGGMTLEPITAWGIQPRGYSTRSELRDLVYAFLPGSPRAM